MVIPETNLGLLRPIHRPVVQLGIQRLGNSVEHIVIVQGDLIRHSAVLNILGSLWRRDPQSDPKSTVGPLGDRLSGESNLQRLDHLANLYGSLKVYGFDGKTVTILSSRKGEYETSWLYSFFRFCEPSIAVNVRPSNTNDGAYQNIKKRTWLADLNRLSRRIDELIEDLNHEKPNKVERLNYIEELTLRLEAENKIHSLNDSFPEDRQKLFEGIWRLILQIQSVILNPS